MTAVRAVTAGEIGYFKGGSGFPLRFQGHRSGDLPFFKVSDMNNPGNELFMRTANNYISEATRKRMGAVRIPAGAIVFAKVGAAVFLERKRILAQDSCIDNNMAALIVDPTQVEVRFAHYLLSDLKLGDLVATTALPSLNGAQLRSIPLRLPSLAEQREVVDVLSSTDELLGSLEQRIGKKRAVKQGLMQELLTGRTRLTERPTEWPLVTLGSAGVVSSGGGDKKIRPGEPRATLLNYMDVYRNEFVNASELWQEVSAPAAKISKCTVRAGDVFFTPTSETPDDIARSAVALEDAAGVIYSYHLVRWRPSGEWDTKYLAFAFQTEEFREQVSTLAAGSGTRYIVSIPGFRGLRIPRPSLKEQQAIGEALSAASSEIGALERRLQATRAIKQGMMQELLTGRTGLVPAEGTA